MPAKEETAKSSVQLKRRYSQEHPWHVYIVVGVLVIAVLFLIPNTYLNGILIKEKAPRIEQPTSIIPKPTGAASFSSFAKLRGEQSYAVAIGDLNNDGSQDIVVANYNQQSLIYYNKGGTFEPSFMFDGAKYTSAVALGDFNKDGWQDVVLLNNRVFSDVWINKKDGTFTQTHLISTEQQQVCCIDLPLGAVVVADFNNDGNQDIIAAYDRKIMMFFNDGAGSFAQKEITDIQHATALAAADINKDGKTDLVVGTDFAKNYILTNNGDETFTKTALPGELYHTTSIAVTDVDRDGDLDVVAGNNNQADIIYYNEGESFKIAALDQSSAYTYDLAIADLNNDDYPDVIAANFNQESYYYINKHDGTFDRQKFSDAGYGRGVAAGDLDGDRDADIVLSRSGNQESEIFKNGLVP